MSKLTSLLKRVDVLGKRPNLIFYGKGRARSTQGGVFSILLLSFVIILTTVISKDIYLREKPIVVETEELVKLKERVPFNSDLFSVALALETPAPEYRYYINESIYEVSGFMFLRETVIKENGKAEIKIKTIELEFEVCHQNSFGKLSHYFSVVDLSNLYCIKSDQLESNQLFLKGIYADPEFASIEIQFNRCINRTDSTKICGTNEEINTLLTDGIFQLFFIDNKLDANNYSNPNQPYLQSYFTTIGSDSGRFVSAALRPVEVISDIGLIGTNEVSVTYFEILRWLDQPSLSKSNNIVKFDIELKNIKKTSERKYTKLIIVFTTFYTLYGTGYLLMSFVLAPFMKLKFYENLVNDQFKFILKYQPTLFPQKKKKDHSLTFTTQRNGDMTDNFENFAAKTPGDDIKTDNCERTITIPDSSDIVNRIPEFVINFNQENAKKIVSIDKRTSTQLPYSVEEYPHWDDPNEDKPSSNQIFELIQNADHESINNKSQIYSTQRDSNKLNQTETTRSWSYNYGNEKDILETARIKIGFCEYLLSNIFRNSYASQKIEIVKKGAKKISKRLDLYHLTKKIREIDLLKGIILDDEQFNLFYNIPQPIILGKAVLNKIEIPNSQKLLQKYELYHKPSTNLVNIKPLIDSVKRKQRKDSVDKRLLELFKKS